VTVAVDDRVRQVLANLFRAGVRAHTGLPKKMAANAAGISDRKA
jgi:hypothetical protein